MNFPKQRDAHLFYGDPDGNGDGQPDAKWEELNLTNFAPPYPMVWSWNKQPVKTIRCHKLCADAMFASLKDIGFTFSKTELEYYQLNECGGAYNFRPMRGGQFLSMHAYGCAIDLAPVLNPLGKQWQDKQRMMPMEAVECFGKHGAIWGGDWNSNGDTLDQRRHDAMHFQFTQPVE